MGIFRRKVPHDYVPIHPDNIGTNNWIIMLEAGTIVGSRTEKLRVAKAAAGLVSWPEATEHGFTAIEFRTITGKLCRGSLHLRLPQICPRLIRI